MFHISGVDHCVDFLRFQHSALFQGRCHALNPVFVNADQFVRPSPKPRLVLFPCIVANAVGAGHSDDLDERRCLIRIEAIAVALLAKDNALGLRSITRASLFHLE